MKKISRSRGPLKPSGPCSHFSPLDNPGLSSGVKHLRQTTAKCVPSFTWRKGLLGKQPKSNPCKRGQTHVKTVTMMPPALVLATSSHYLWCCLTAVVAGDAVLPPQHQNAAVTIILPRDYNHHTLSFDHHRRCHCREPLLSSL